MAVVAGARWHVTRLGSLAAYIAPLDYNHLDITSMTQIHPLDLLNLTESSLAETVYLSRLSGHCDR
jgi:hypothetical protein